MRRWLVLVGFLLCNDAIATQVRPEIRAVTAPTTFVGSDGQSHLAYELSITGSSDARVERLDVLSDADGTPLTTYSASDLEGRTMRPGAKPEVRYGRVIQAGADGMIHVWLTLPNKQSAPAALRHRLVLLSQDGIPVPVGDVPTKVMSTRPLVLSAPLRAGTWFAHNAPGNHRSAHWGSVLVADGRTLVPQRYAIDFLGLDSEGRLVRGDIRKSTNQDWLGFGAEVIAVADGVVREILDGVIDNPPLVEPPRPSNPSAAATYGNYVVLEINDTTFVHYAHLQRDSVTVKVGQRVRRGQKLGLLGNSGNTNGAHLHFNVTDSPRPEESDGLPFVFASFELLGSTTAERAAGEDNSPSNFTQSPSRRREELPLDRAVVRFQ
jgi:hypothetical protein